MISNRLNCGTAGSARRSLDCNWSGIVLTIGRVSLDELDPYLRIRIDEATDATLCSAVEDSCTIVESPLATAVFNSDVGLKFPSDKLVRLWKERSDFELQRLVTRGVRRSSSGGIGKLFKPRSGFCDRLGVWALRHVGFQV